MKSRLVFTHLSLNLAQSPHYLAHSNFMERSLFFYHFVKTDASNLCYIFISNLTDSLFFCKES